MPLTSEQVGVVVLAAGEGARLGFPGPKATAVVAGRSLVAHALTGLAAAGLPPPVVVFPPGRRDELARALDQLRVARFVEGGGTRTESVRAGIDAVMGPAPVVVIHEAARPLMPPEVIRRVVDAVLGDDDVVAAAPSLPVSDMLKRIDADSTVCGTVDRDQLVEVQTPQALLRAPFERALRTDDGSTDDLGLLERLVELGELDGRVRVVEGSVFGRKVTVPDDLIVLEHLGEALGAVGSDGEAATEDALP